LELRVSSSARRLRWRGTSKITPHKVDAFGEFLKAMFEVFDDHDVSLSRILKIAEKITAGFESEYTVFFIDVALRARAARAGDPAFAQNDNENETRSLR
jgi:hypothetical protein